MKARLAVALLMVAIAGVHYVHAASEISITTDKDSYKKGDTVTLNGMADTGTRIAIEVKDSEDNTIMLRTATADSEGKFDLKFKIPTTASDGPINVIANANVDGRTITASVQPKMDSVPESTIQNTGKSSGCLIATAAFGSELEPQVQLLREVRDNTVLSTSSGVTFMEAFNEFYYSFSPIVADWERQNDMFRHAVRLTITPMVSTLSILQHVDIQSEQQMLSYGIGIILLNGGIYFGMPLGLVFAFRRLRR